MEIDTDLKSRIIQSIDNDAMKNQSICDGGIDINDAEVQSAIMQNKGGFGRDLAISDKQKRVVTVRWNKKEFFFACSIAILKKQNTGKWHCETRFDDAHDCRHCDVDSPVGKAKIFDGEFTLFKVECPVLIHLVKSLPKEKADEWKIKLFKEFMLGNERKKKLTDSIKT